MRAYMTTAGRMTRLASQKMPLGRERTHAHYFTRWAPRTCLRSPEAFWVGLTLSVMGSITQTAAWLWMLTGGTG